MLCELDGLELGNAQARQFLPRGLGKHEGQLGSRGVNQLQLEPVGFLAVLARERQLTRPFGNIENRSCVARCSFGRLHLSSLVELDVTEADAATKKLDTQVDGMARELTTALLQDRS